MNKPHNLSLPAPPPTHALLRDQPRSGVPFPRVWLAATTSFGGGDIPSAAPPGPVAPALRQNPLQRGPERRALARDAKAVLLIMAAANPAVAREIAWCGAQHAAKDPVQPEAASSAATIAVQDPMHREKARGSVGSGHDGVHGAKTPGPLRNGNPRGNPNLAPRCGAKTRLGCPCKSPAMGNGRCRMHGGTSTGPKTAEGKARIAAARRASGDPAMRTLMERTTTILRRGRVLQAMAKSGVSEAAMVAMIAAVRGRDASAAGPPSAMAAWQGLTEPALTAGETRALVAAIRGVGAKEALQREAVQPFRGIAMTQNGPRSSRLMGLRWSAQGRP